MMIVFFAMWVILKYIRNELWLKSFLPGSLWESFFKAHVLLLPSSGFSNYCFLKIFFIELSIYIVHVNESIFQCQERLRLQQRFRSVYVAARMKN